MIKIFIDANILYSNTIRSLFIWLHINRVLQIYWSIEAWEEAFRAFARTNDTEKASRFRASMTKNAIAKYPECMVANFDIKPLGLKDPDDEHILAAALMCRAEFIMTSDQILLAEQKDAWAFKLIRPDDLLVHHICPRFPKGTFQSVTDHISSLTTTKPTMETYSQSLCKNDLIKFTEWYLKNIRTQGTFV